MAWIRCTGNPGGSLKARTASGAIASFETNMADVLQEVKCEINATGGNGTPDNPNPIVGYSSANITRCRVNFLPTLTAQTVSQSGMEAVVGSDGNISINGTSISSGSLVLAENNSGLFTMPSGLYLHMLNDFATAQVAFIFDFKDGSSDGPSFNAVNRIWQMPSTNVGKIVTKIRVYFISGVTITNGKFSPMLALSSTAIPYTPYNGQTYVIAFGQTVYGGVLDVTRGKLTVTWTIIDLGDEALNYSYNSTYHRFDCSNDLGAKPAPDNNTPANALCSCYKNGCVNDVGTDDKFFYIAPASGNGKLRVVDTDYSDVATFKTAVSGQKVAYELATPIDIDLTPAQIEALLGINNVWHDGNGDTEVKYLEVVRN